MLVFSCHICKTVLSADEAQAGQLVRCAQCKTTLRVPTNAPGTTAANASVNVGAYSAVGTATAAAPRAQAPAQAPAQPQPRPPIQTRVTLPSQFRTPGGGKRYGFNCAYCSSRLEATEAMAAQEGQCPTCGNTITIPILDRYGRLIDPVTKQIIKQDPHPVHAYAAAGDRAPKILRQANGNQVIQCPRCGTMSTISSNNCKSCGMPFTMEGTTLEAAGGSNGFCVASLVLGIIGIPAGCTGITPLLAVVFGIIGLNQVNKSGAEGAGKGMAIAGIVCGIVGLMLFGYILLH
jgi:phage FluMu protein Com